MKGWRAWLAVALVVVASVVAARLIVTNRPRAAGNVEALVKPTPEQVRNRLFEELQPVSLANCELRRFGEPHDGGYLMCANLLGAVQSGYSYGISGYDQWGCDISRRLRVPVHQYDCFDLDRPACPGGRTVFHAECVGPAAAAVDGRPFDTLERQLEKNGDRASHVVVKMDVEGAEWNSMLGTPDAVFENIDQMIFELHGVDDNIARSLEMVLKLKRHFHVAHFHINNHSCLRDIQPFGGWAYEVTLVNKRLAKVDPNGKVALPSPLDTPNNPGLPDCQTVPGPIR
jgi:hypothetical protein